MHSCELVSSLPPVDMQGVSHGRKPSKLQMRSFVKRVAEPQRVRVKVSTRARDLGDGERVYIVLVACAQRDVSQP